MKKTNSIKKVASISAGLMAIAPIAAMVSNQIMATTWEAKFDTIYNFVVAGEDYTITGTTQGAKNVEVTYNGTTYSSETENSGVVLNADGTFEITVLAAASTTGLSYNGVTTGDKFGFDVTVNPADDIASATPLVEQVEVDVLAQAPTVSVTGVSNDTTMGTVSGSDAAAVVGSKVTLVAAPKADYEFVKWTDAAGKTVSTNATFEVTAGTSNSTYTAVFQAVAPATVSVTGVSNDATMGTVSGSNSTATVGSSVTLTAISKPGYEFVKWVDAVGATASTNATFVVTAATDVSYTAIFQAVAPATVSITAVANDTTMGSVSGSATDLVKGAKVNLIATPKTGYEFVKWTDAAGTTVSTNATFEAIAGDADATYTAVFQIKAADKVTITAVANDTTMGAVSGSATVDSGSSVKLKATPTTGHRFVKWVDAAGTTVSTDSEITITATADATYTAVFEVNPVKNFTVKTAVNNTSYGTAIGDATVEEGKSVTLKAVANTGYSFVKWIDSLGNSVSTSNTFTVTPTADVTYTAVFKASSSKTFNVSVKSNSTSKGTVTGGGSYNKGTNATISASAKENYKFSHWEDEDGNPVSNDRDYTFEVEKAVKYTAYFVDIDAIEVPISILDEDDDGVADVTITIYDSKNKKVGSYKTDDNGDIVAELTDGKYSFTITKYDEDNDDNFFYPTESYNFTVKESGKVTGTDEIVLKKAIVELTRVDGVTGAAIRNATLSIFNNSGTKIAEVKTDNKGIATVKGLQVGTYTYSESTPASGYSVDQSTYTFTVNKDGSLSGDVESKTCSFKVTLAAKDKATDKGLSNVTIYLYNAKGDLAGIYQTGATGSVEISGIPAGTYTLKQGNLPSGYKDASTSVVTFSVNEKGVVTGDTTIYSTNKSTANTDKDKTDSNDAPPADNTDNKNNNTSTDKDSTKLPEVEKPDNISDKDTDKNTDKNNSSSTTGTVTVDKPSEIITTGVESEKKTNTGAIVGMSVAGLATIGGSILAILKRKKK